MLYHKGAFYTEDGYWVFIDRVERLIEAHPEWPTMSLREKRFVYYTTYEEERDYFDRHYKRAMQGGLL